MKKLSLLILLVFALAAGFAQTPFTATYTFSTASGHTTPYPFSGTQPTGLTMGDMVTVGASVSGTNGYLRAKEWPTASSIDTGKYIGFTIDADAGYTFEITGIDFGLYRSNTGPNKAEWRGSADGFATAINSYTALNSNISNVGGVLTLNSNTCKNNIMANTNITDPVTPLVGYSNLTTCGFNLYMYNALAAGGTGGIEGAFTVRGNVYSSGTPTPTITITGTPLNDFTYIVGNGPSTAQSFKVGGTNLTADIMVSAPTNFEVSLSENSGYSGSLNLTPTSGTVTATDVYVRLVANLNEGSYSGSLQCTSTGATTQNISLSGSVTDTPPDPPSTAGRYFVDFEGQGETTTGYGSETVNLSGLNWDMTESLIGTLAADYKEGARSARFKGSSASSSMTMLQDWANGASGISFKYRRYANAKDGEAEWAVEYSTDQGQNWYQAGANFIPTDQVQTFFAGLDVTGNVRMRIVRVRTVGTGSDRRLNIDNIIITNNPPMFDFYNYVHKQVVNDNITITGGDANYNTSATPGDIPNAQNFTASFHNCLTLLGSGPWTIDIKNTNPDPNQVANWAAYKQGGNWYSTALTDGVGSLTVTAAKNQDIELLIGKGNDPTLPVTLSHFSATMTAENYVQLTWISQTETNLMGYNVYRSNSDNLSSAAQICPMIEGTNTSQAQTYVYVDKDLVEDGTYYYWLQNVDLDGSNAFHGPVSVVFSITGNGGTPPIPTATQLDNAYPNPFNPNTTIRYQLEGAGKVKIEIYNTRGQLVRSFEKGHDAAGHYGIVWDGRDSSGRELPSGVYLYKMSCGKYSSSKKMVLKK